MGSYLLADRPGFEPGLRDPKFLVPFEHGRAAFRKNWWQVSDTADRSQVHQRRRQPFHPIVPLLHTLEPQEQPLELSVTFRMYRARDPDM
jgi:hypothetical protein